MTCNLNVPCHYHRQDGYTTHRGKHMTCNLNVPVTTTDKMDIPHTEGNT